MAQFQTHRQLVKVAALLFGSGLCALVYQTAWLRSLRLVFGGSTLATSAVLAIFMGGLGLGGWLIGKRVDRHDNPLRLYAHLEIAVGILALISPWLVDAVRWFYITLGGTSSLGETVGTLLRLALSAVVLGVPAFLMGGTLPAAARAVEKAGDHRRRRVATLYGINTLGAVTGVLLTTFLTLEILGVQRTILVFGLLNVLIGLVARRLAANWNAPEAPSSALPSPESHDGAPPETPAWTYRVALVISGLVGFVFLAMELVWFRMLAPLLGGSSYTFGLILAVALLGIGLGGVLYSRRRTKAPPGLAEIAWTCALEALFIGLPFAWGDDLAALAVHLRQFGQLGFVELVLGWTFMTTLIVLPAAVVSGYQFPLLIGILGSGRDNIGRQVGHVYASNTVGAILGSLLGGFVLLPAMTATGAWRFGILLLVLTGLASLGLHTLTSRRAPSRPGIHWGRPTVLLVLAALTLTAQGPSAFWRHRPIGAGLVALTDQSPNAWEATKRRARRNVVAQWEGIESSVAQYRTNSDAFVVNGKVDGNVIGDTPTQIMSGLIAAALHSGVPRKAMVVGLGTGQSAGWLAEVPTMEMVDVVELEPAVIAFAEGAAATNFDVTRHPKVSIIRGDAREILTTREARWDIVFSEPSNPYRAGVSSLFTQEFYEAVSGRLNDDGIFVQWTQLYHIDGQTLRTVLATLRSVFPHLQIWQSKLGADLALIASKQPLVVDVPKVRQRLQQEPLRSALAVAWGVADLPGLLTGFIANDGVGDAVLKAYRHDVATDDLNPIEYGFARALGRKNKGLLPDVSRFAAGIHADRPSLSGGEVDRAAVAEALFVRAVKEGSDFARSALKKMPPGPHRFRAEARLAYMRGDLGQTLASWRKQPTEPKHPFDAFMLSESRAFAGVNADVTALSRTQRLLVEATGFAAKKQISESVSTLIACFDALRTDPWVPRASIARTLTLAVDMARTSPDHGKRLFEAIAKGPLSVGLQETLRLKVLREIALNSDFKALCVQAYNNYEPHYPWTRRFLENRARCLLQNNDPRAEEALEDLQSYLDNAAPGFDAPSPNGATNPTP